MQVESLGPGERRAIFRQRVLQDLVTNEIERLPWFYKRYDGSLPRIPLPRDIFAPRINSRGVPLWEDGLRASLSNAIGKALAAPQDAATLVGATERRDGPVREITDPSNRERKLGRVYEASDAAVSEVLMIADKASDMIRGKTAPEAVRFPVSA